MSLSEEISAMLREQAWERAKGELQSMLHTFYGDRERYTELAEAIRTFIKNIEDEGLDE